MMATSAGRLLEEGDFALGVCRVCEREALTYPEDEDEPELRRCVHCDTKISGELRWTDAAGLEAVGYEMDSGGGCRSCISGGCAVTPRRS